MRFEDLVKTRQSNWARLEYFLGRIEKDQISSLSESELVEFGQLYRATTSDLALAQREFPEHPVTQYLNQLVGRAHPIVYRGNPLIWRQLRRFYERGLPQLYRQVFPFILAAGLIFFGTAVTLYAGMLANPGAARYVLSPSQIALIKDGTKWWQDLNEANAFGSAFIMTHNLQVAFFAYAGGMTLGLLTVLVLLLNGMSLGAVFGLLQAYGHAGPLWEFVIGHGVLELSEITMAGGAGLMLGLAILRPGLLSRRDSLGVAAQKSIRLLLGTAPLLIIAGIIEGMISPSDAIPAYIKFGIGIGTGLLLYGYLFLAGRSVESR